MKKRLIAIVFAGVMVLSLTACAEKKSGTLTGAEAEAKMSEIEQRTNDIVGSAIDLGTPLGGEEAEIVVAKEGDSAWACFKGMENLQLSDLVSADMLVTGEIIASSETPEELEAIYNVVNTIKITGVTDVESDDYHSELIECITANGYMLRIFIDGNYNMIVGDTTYTINQEGVDAILNFIEAHK